MNRISAITGSFLCFNLPEGVDLVSIWRYSTDNERLPQREDLTKKLPIEVICHIFSFLHPKEVLNNATICRRWNTLVGSEVVKSGDKTKWLCDSLWKEYGSQLGEIFPNVCVLGQSVWTECFGLEALKEAGIPFTDKDGIPEFRDIPVCTKATILGLNRMLAIPTEEGVEGDRFKVTVLVMPEGLSLNRMIELARYPEGGLHASLERCPQRVLDDLGERVVGKTYLVALTDSILRGSRFQTALKQEGLVSQNACQMPDPLEIITLYFLRYIDSSIMSPIRLLGDSTCTHCVQQHELPYIISIGGFTRSSFYVYLAIPSDSCEFTGVVARKRLGIKS